MRLLGISIAVLAVCVIAVVVSSGAVDWGAGAPAAQPTPMEEPADSGDDVVAEVLLEQIFEDPAAFEGAEVVVRGASIAPIEPDGGFVLRDDGRRMLLYARADVPELPPGDEIAVRAEVVRFTEPAAESLGEGFGDAEGLARTPTGVGDPYLLFRSIVSAGAGGAQDRGPAGSAANRSRLVDIVEDPRRYWGDAVTVAGEVTRGGPRVFVLEADGRELLVVPQRALDADLRAALEHGAVVRAQGLVERVPPAGSGELLAERRLFDRYAGEPSLSATSVSVLD